LPAPTRSEAAFERLLAQFDQIEGPLQGHELPELAPIPNQAEEARAFLDDLFSRRRTFVQRDRYATIGDADDFFTKIVGVSFEGRQAVVAGLVADMPLELVREPGNPHDPNAIAVRYGTLQLGYLRRPIAKHLAPNVDAGDRYSASVGSVTGGGQDKHIGVNIHVRRHRVRPTYAHGPAAPSLAGTGVQAIQSALIGEGPLREAQRAVLERLGEGRNTLAVLGTGRGKSFCFQLPAAQRALERGTKTVVFYPLRALANDQYEALKRRLSGFGLRILRANGSIEGDERAQLSIALEDGSWDLMLATPEFASFHQEAFARACNRPQLVVVDEAHHVHESRHRPAYGALGNAIASLGNPQVLALTATAGDAAFREIRRALRVDAWVIDPTVRDNLHVVDARNTTDKLAYLARELDGEGKAIVYCNSRSEATRLAERLRAALGGAVAFYHGTVPAAERAAVEGYFRAGALRVVVATSAFGEGIDLPDIRDVVLYHLNFNLTEFNQQAGRAGRDGRPARIHLLYGETDRRINDYIIARQAPSLTTLRELYRGMRGLTQDGALRTNAEDVARTLELDLVDATTVSAAVRIWEEAGLVETGRDDDGRFTRFVPAQGRVDLTRTTRYAEGLAERESFDRYCALALGADAVTLEALVNRPIYPDRVALSSP
jgi:single-stranded-DNA-specific exonuclease